MRASDRLRDRTAADLRAGCVAGALSADTYELRLGRALVATTEEELRWLVADLRTGRSLLERGLDAARRALAGPVAPRPIPVSLADAPLVLGRAGACDVVLADLSVSRRHAELRPTAGLPLLVDLGSSNGTWVNGQRVLRSHVAPDDAVQLGDVVLRLTG